MGVIDGAEGVLDVEEAALVLAEVDAVVALEVDLDEDEPLVVLALDRLEEAALAEDLLEDQVVGGGQVVEVVLRRRPLLRARDLVPHGWGRGRFREVQVFTETTPWMMGISSGVFTLSCDEREGDWILAFCFRRVACGGWGAAKRQIGRAHV